MSIFGWSVSSAAPAAGTAAANASCDRARSHHVPEPGEGPPPSAIPQREIYDVILNRHRYVPAVTVRSSQPMYSKVPAPPVGGGAAARRPASSGADNTTRGRGAAVASLLKDADTAVAVSPRFVRGVREEAVVDANPSTFLAMSHAYNRRVFSRGSMRAANDANLVGSYAEKNRNHNADRMRVAGAPGALVSIHGDAIPSRPTTPRGPGQRYARKPPTTAASDGITIAAAAAATTTSAGGHADSTCGSRCHVRQLGSAAAQTSPRGSGQTSRPMTARQVLQDLSFRVRVAQAHSDTASRPNTARSTRGASATTSRPLSGRSVVRSAAETVTAADSATSPRSATTAREAAETRDAISSFESRLDSARRAQRPAGANFAEPIRTPLTPDTV